MWSEVKNINSCNSIDIIYGTPQRRLPVQVVEILKVLLL